MMHISLFKTLLLLFLLSMSVMASATPSENQKYIDDIIYNKVRMGLSSIEDIENHIVETIQDNEFEKEFSKSWVKSRVKQEYEKLLLESRNWKKPTDVMLLIKAFNELSENGIIALHNAGYTTSDGGDEVTEVVTILKKKGIKKPRGYCFYHQQDLERALVQDKPSLYLTFNSDKIGQEIVSVLKKYNFKINWDGTSDNKIQIINFKWQKLYDPTLDISDYSQVIKLLSK